MLISKGMRILEAHKQNLQAGSTVRMPEYGSINEAVFLEWLQHFRKHRTSGKSLFLLDGHN
jgi:hypothetical protein